MKLGELIVKYRTEHKMSQRQFAKKCGGLSNGYVSMLENDFNPATQKAIVPSLDKLKCIAEGMDMTLNELLEIADDMPVELIPESKMKKNEVIEPEAAVVNHSATLSTDAIEFALEYDMLPDKAQKILKKMLDILKEYV